MKKIIFLLLGLAMLSGQCWAMAFSPPERIGLACFINLRNGIEILGANEVQTLPTPFRFEANIPRGAIGAKKLNDGKDALYVHYNTNAHQYLFGGKDINNTIGGGGIGMPECTIYKIATDSNVTLYLLNSGYDIAEDGNFAVIGRRDDGVFVKYFDTETLSKNFFGSHWGVYFAKFNVQADCIVIYYERTIGHGFSPINVDERGYFSFKWDDNAQWFGVEQVVY